MVIGKEQQHLKFKSSFLASILTKCFGLMLILTSLDFLGGWLHLSWSKLPYLLLFLPLGLSLSAVGGMLLLCTAQIQILNGELRFRRFLTWEAVPLNAIREVRSRGLIYIRVSYGRKRWRLLANPEDFKPRLYRLPIDKFLREVCSRNTTESEPHA
jgi:hypothetical protein